MKLSTSALLLLFSVLLFACSNPLLETNKAMRAQIIGVHDEVMPKMGELMSLEKKALAQADSLSQADSSTTAKIEELKALAAQLKQANEGMFVWMRQYSLEEEGKSPEEIKFYLDEQILLVEQTKKDIQAALAQASSLLQP